MVTLVDEVRNIALRMSEEKENKVQKAGLEGLRTDSGHRQFWQTTLPTEEAKKKAMKDANNAMFQADCPCCGTCYCIPSEQISVRAHGVCTACKQFLDGKREGVIAIRMPTLEEALAAHPKSILTAEAEVIRAELMKYRGDK